MGLHIMKKALAVLLSATMLVPFSMSAKDIQNAEINRSLSEAVPQTSSINLQQNSNTQVFFSAGEDSIVTLYITIKNAGSVSGILSDLSYNANYLTYLDCQTIYQNTYINRLSRSYAMYCILFDPNGISMDSETDIVAFRFQVEKDVMPSKSCINFTVKELYGSNMDEINSACVGYRINGSSGDGNDSKHTHTEVIDPAVEATCTTTGLTEGSHCEVCGDVIIPQQITPMLPHTVVIDPYIAPTENSSGLTEGTHCSVCGQVLTPQEIIPALTHIHTVVIDSAVEATCTQTGLTEGSHCGVCNEILVPQEVIPKRSHTIVIDPEIMPTENSSGLTQGAHCGVCGEILIPQQYIPPLEHTHSIVIDPAVKATCTQTGLTEGSHCEVCGETIVPQEIIPQLPHTVVIDSAVEATCTQTGLTEGSHCGVCGEILTPQEIVPKIPHHYEDGKCTVCGEPDPDYNKTPTQTGFYGDVNGDGKITAFDALMILRATINLTELDDKQILLADVNNDGKMTASDALQIQRFVIGMNTNSRISDPFTE